MKINPKYCLKNVGGKNIVVADSTMRMDGIVTLNDTAEFIWRKIEHGAETDEIVASLAAECEVDADEIKGEVVSFIEKLKGAGIIE
ncbi:MAG: PqqD family protein [Clostridia bacterium]|nr:PqqD family protein [Clostridia bacterium]